MRSLYRGLIRLVAPFAYLAVLWRGFEDQAYWQGLGERFGWAPPLDGRPLWLHAVSLGEMSAAAPLIRALRAQHPQLPLLLTTATPAGRARAQALFAGQATIRFLPYDTPGAVRRFLDGTRPRAGALMETELWPTLLGACAERAIPLLIANARLSPRSVARYRRFGGLFRGVFAGPITIAAQSSDDAARFVEIGACESQVQVAGNLKFDLELGVDLRAEAQGTLRTQLGTGRAVWVAGSTHDGEDEAVLEAHAALRSRYPDALLLLAPRHRDRFEAVASLLARHGVAFVRRSAGIAPGTDDAVLLVDTLGELTRLYAASDVVFVGGSLVPVGGHNLLEPAALGLPVLTGPSIDNGRDVATQLLEAGAARCVADAAQLAAQLKELFSSPEARRRMGEAGLALVTARRGAVARLAAILAPWVAGAARPSAAR